VPARFTLLHLSGEDDLALDPAPRHESQPPGEAERSLFFGSISRVATVHCVSGPRRSSRSSTAREAYPFPLAAGKPPEELLVPSFDKQLRVARTRWLERDRAVGCLSELGLSHRVASASANELLHARLGDAVPVATSRNRRHTSTVSDGLDMRGRYETALAEVEDMKRQLREHAQRVAAREKELEELRLEVAGRQGRRRPAAAAVPAGPDRSEELARKIAEAEKREREAVQELALAKAERERLDEREQAIRKVERELAGLRMHLQEERKRLTDTTPTEPEPAGDPKPESEPPPPTPLPQPPSEPDLDPAAGAKLRRSSMVADPQLKKQN
jgi:hypothetical protein